MPLRVVPLTEHELPATRAFNARMLAGRAPTDFLLPENLPQRPFPSNPTIIWTHYVVVDGPEVRGGVVEMNQPAVLNGSLERVMNYQSPLSEAILDRRYGLVSLSLIRFMERQGAGAFAVGMGWPSNPFPRALRAAGWSVRPVPFYFRVHRANRVLRELTLFRKTAVSSLLADVARLTGLGALGFKVTQFRRASQERGIVQVSSWDTWADDLWNTFQVECSLAVSRDRKTLEDLYPSTEPRLLRFLIRRGQKPVGWSIALLTQNGHRKYFGNLRVGSILDCVAESGEMQATVQMTDSALAARGADLVVSNQSHVLWRSAFRRSGFLPGPSNFLLGMSKRLFNQVSLQPSGEDRIHLNRGDGDGRIHL